MRASETPFPQQFGPATYTPEQLSLYGDVFAHICVIREQTINHDTDLDIQEETTIIQQAFADAHSNVGLHPLAAQTTPKPC
jgi:hypothetical protein